VPHYLMEATLAGVLAQRLVRLLCPHCKADDGHLSDEAWARRGSTGRSAARNAGRPAIEGARDCTNC